MGNTAIALTLVLFINMLMFLGQAAVLELNEDNSQQFYDYEGNILSEYDSNNNQSNPILDQSNSAANLPSGSSGIELSPSGGFLTDTFTSIRDWISQTLGLTYMKQILTAPYNILSAMQLPQAMVYAIGTMWYALSLFLVISFIWGRE